MTFAEQLKQLGFETYAEYLESDHWKAFRDSYRAAGLKMTCVVCGLAPAQFHHRTYERLGRELHQDVSLLCDQHHEAVHKWLSDRKLPVTKTFKAIAFLVASHTGTKPPPKIGKNQRKKRNRKQRNKKMVREAKFGKAKWLRPTGNARLDAINANNAARMGY